MSTVIDEKPHGAENILIVLSFLTHVLRNVKQVSFLKYFALCSRFESLQGRQQDIDDNK